LTGWPSQLLIRKLIQVNKKPGTWCAGFFVFGNAAKGRAATYSVFPFV
jgi:hypothetical protein